MTEFKEKRLGEILAAKGYVTEEQITRLLVRSNDTGKLIEEILVEAGHISGSRRDEEDAGKNERDKQDDGNHGERKSAEGKDVRTAGR